MKKGYVGIGVYHPKTKENIGTLWRTAHNFNCDFIFTIGKRYGRQASDTTNARRHIPLYEYTDFEDFKNHLPLSCEIICLEQTTDSQDIKDFVHPNNCVYLLGAEDHGLPIELMKNYQKVHIESPMSLNVAVAGSIVIYDRTTKLKLK